MTINRKIIGGYVLILVMMAIVVALTFYSLSTIQSSYDRFIDVHEKLAHHANDLRFELRDQIAHLRGLLLFPDEKKRFLENLQEDYKQVNAIIEEMRRLVITEEGRRMVDDIAALQVKTKQVQEKVISLVQQGKEIEAKALNRQEVRPLTEELINKAERLGEREMKIMSEGRAWVTATVSRLSIVMVVFSIIALIAGLAIGFFTSRSISRQLREGVTRLSSSSAEILTTTAQIVSGATETATAVSETTTTVEEVKQTVQVASDKAKYVSENAQRTTQIAQQGKKAVEDLIAGINNIRERMESIAENTVRLSEQGQAIGEIIATVNDIADQSNLLAVNAAIEAAKAGEQGKGFSVVAQEIRSLSEQSKQATTRVRTILTDIQKGTSSAVMATEQGNKAVETGIRQSLVADESIQVLAESIVEAAQASTQISASSQQQKAGMDQIASAMENINQATTQNLAGIKQAEQAAQNLHELAELLRSMIEGKKVQM
jgi:methyl-accepting chemotaxis protein